MDHPNAISNRNSKLYTTTPDNYDDDSQFLNSTNDDNNNYYSTTTKLSTSCHTSSDFNNQRQSKTQTHSTTNDTCTHNMTTIISTTTTDIETGSSAFSQTPSNNSNTINNNEGSQLHCRRRFSNGAIDSQIATNKILHRDNEHDDVVAVHMTDKDSKYYCNYYEQSTKSGSCYSSGGSTTTTGSSSCDCRRDSMHQPPLSNDYHQHHVSNGMSSSCGTTTTTTKRSSLTTWRQQLILLHYQFMQRLHWITVARLSTVHYCRRSGCAATSVAVPNRFSFLQLWRRSSNLISCRQSKKQPTRNKNKNGIHLLFRKIHPSDKQEIQRLHEQWFPVKYVDEFYDDLVYERMSSTGDPLYTSVGTIAPSRVATLSASVVENNCHHENRNNSDTNLQHHQSSSSLSSSTSTAEFELPQEPSIVACVVGCFITATTLSGQLQKLLITNIQQHTKLFYIMTVGTTIRHQGIGTILIEQCIQQVQQDPACGVLYLHVLTTNRAAIQMYERLGFHRVIEIPNYYTIDNIRHNCYLYAKFYHGNRGHLSDNTLMYSSWTTARDYCMKIPTTWKSTLVNYYLSLTATRSTTSIHTKDDDITVPC